MNTRTVLSLLGTKYPATDQQPGYAAMRGALQTGGPLMDAIRIEVDAANASGNSARLRGALEFLLRALETCEANGATYTLDPATPAAVRTALSLPKDLRRSALVVLDQQDADFALASLCDLVQKINRSSPLRFVEQLPDADRKRREQHTRSGCRGIASGGGSKSQQPPRVRHGAAVRN